jgi:hypothetical protein
VEAVSGEAAVLLPNEADDDAIALELDWTYDGVWVMVMTGRPAMELVDVTAFAVDADEEDVRVEGEGEGEEDGEDEATDDEGTTRATDDVAGEMVFAAEDKAADDYASQFEPSGQCQVTLAVEMAAGEVSLASAAALEAIEARRAASWTS